MKKLLSIAAIAFLFSIAPALADEQCENDCMQNGYNPKFCKERCADNFNPLNNQQTTRQVEPKCLDDCTSSGHDKTYCSKACSY